MDHNSIIFPFFLIFVGAGLFSTLALYTGQSLLVAYMLFGIVFGPWGFKAISDLNLVYRVDDIGVIFFMFLLGMQLQPQNLLRMMGKTIFITVFSSLIFCSFGFIIGFLHGYSLIENLIIGSCMMFSSTIVSLKLLSDKDSNNKKINEIMVSVLLLQDLIAIMVLLCIDTVHDGKFFISKLALITLALPSILFFVFLVERVILRKIFAKFSQVHEYVTLISIAWCLGVAQLAKTIGLSYEVGAFFAGIALAASPVSSYSYIAVQLKPIRDFFLVLFFFVIGASFNLQYLGVIVIPALMLTAFFMILKPLVFGFLLSFANDYKDVAWEAGVRLSQLSEFSLLVTFLAYRNEFASHSIIYLVQAVTMFMFIVSSYLVVVCYPPSKQTVSIPVDDD